MATDISLITADDLLNLPHNGYRYELVKGKCIQKPLANHKQGKITARIGFYLTHFIVEHRLGVTYATGTGFILHSNPDTVRAPDVSFVSQKRLEALGEIEGFFPGAPDLAVEVISPNDTYTQVEDKAVDWLRAGTQMVIVLDPNKKTATIYRDLDDIVILTQDQTIENNALLPGWSLSLQDLFK